MSDSYPTSPSGNSDRLTEQILIGVFLLLAYPIALIVMWIRRPWTLLWHILITLPAAGFTALVALGLLISIVVPEEKLEQWNNESVQTTEFSDRQKSSPLVVDVERFLATYNQGLSSMNSKLRMTVDNVQNIDNERKTIGATSNEYNALLITADSDNRIESVIYFGTGGGSLESGVDVMISTAALVMACENRVPDNQYDRKEIIERFGLTDRSSLHQDRSFIRNGFKYTKTFNSDTGIAIVVKPQY